MFAKWYLEASLLSATLTLLAFNTRNKQPDFTEEECAEVIQAIRAAIDGDRYVLSPRVRRLKSALAKLDPASAERIVTPFPPPKPSGTPSLVYQRLKGGRRRR